MADDDGGYPEYEKCEEGEFRLDHTYLTLMWSYLNHMLIPGNTPENFNPSFSPFPDDATYQRLMEMIRYTIDPYISVSDADNRTIITMEDYVVQDVRQDLVDLGFNGEIDHTTYVYFQSVPYSNLPILLLYALGLVPAIFDDPFSYSAPSLYPNEWKALLRLSAGSDLYPEQSSGYKTELPDAGISLCARIRDNSYFYWLIENSWKGHSISIIGADRPENVLPHLPGYTVEDIINNIRSDPECYRDDFDLREIRRIFDRRRNEIIRDDNLTERMEEQYDIEISEGRFPSELEQRRRRQQIARRRASINEQMLLLDQIQEAINALDELRRDITVRPRII